MKSHIVKHHPLEVSSRSSLSDEDDEEEGASYQKNPPASPEYLFFESIRCVIYDTSNYLVYINM